MVYGPPLFRISEEKIYRKNILQKQVYWKPVFLELLNCKSSERILTKGQIISKRPLICSNSPKKRTNEFIFTTTTNSFVRFLGEFEDTKKSF